MSNFCLSIRGRARNPQLNVTPTDDSGVSAIRPCLHLPGTTGTHSVSGKAGRGQSRVGVGVGVKCQSKLREDTSDRQELIYSGTLPRPHYFMTPLLYSGTLPRPHYFLDPTTFFTPNPLRSRPHDYRRASHQSPSYKGKPWHESAVKPTQPGVWALGWLSPGNWNY